jgi:hypothetical protein
LAVQAKFGQYLQDAKNPRSISQTEKAVEREQIRSNEQILPTPGLESHSSSPRKIINKVKIKEKIENFTLMATFSWNL